LLFTDAFLRIGMVLGTALSENGVASQIKTCNFGYFVFGNGFIHCCKKGVLSQFLIK
jgi:hypothetical protein